MVFVVLQGLLLLALLALEVVDDRLDGDRRPRDDHDAEAPDQDVAEKGRDHHCAFHRLALLSLVQEVFVVIGREVGLRACLAAEGLAVADLLQVVEAAGDALVARGVEGVEGDAGATVHAGVDLGAGQDRVQVCVHDAGGGGGVGVDEVGVLVGLVVRALRVAVAQGRLQNGQSRYGLAVATELGLALLVGGLDGCLDLGDGLGVGLRDDEAHAVLGRAAVDGLRLPDVRVAPAGVDAGDDLHGIADFRVLTHCRFPP